MILALIGASLVATYGAGALVGAAFVWMLLRAEWEREIGTGFPDVAGHEPAD